ncbi:DMT family transporter [Clostridium tyrobutyricum]|uniref:DMT family transporter n=1 Tax=Clostridium tyrobutyricum TaxID=1519 RepID=UPI001C394290|nr:DMT family transporter [Clostridium tyrobutyricum]MBV4419229.1 DMT family transporter [Clostridium tyrobutyricum]
MEEKNKSLLKIHLSVFLFGLSGLFGKLISLPSTVIVFGRVFFSSIFLFIILIYFKKNILLKQKKDYFYIILMGIILAIHWTTFFKAIQVSTIAIALLTFSTFPVFITFIEPYFFKDKIKLWDIISAIITFLGIIFIVPKFQLTNNLTQGALWGMLSGFAYAILSMLNRKYVQQYSSLVISFYEQLIAAVVLIPFLFFQKHDFTVNNIILLILLGVVFTAISHSLFINGLKYTRAQTASIISSLEPVYAIVFAAFILQEMPSLREIVGGIIILGIALYSTIKSKKEGVVSK